MPGRCGNPASECPQRPESPPSLPALCAANDCMMVFRFNSFSCSVLSALFLVWASGCRKPDEIVAYTVAKPPARDRKADLPDGKPTQTERQQSDAAAVEGQLLGAILPRGETTWFFKLPGPRAAVESQASPFVQFVRSVTFSKNLPEWTLPENWQQEAASEMRFATLRIATEEGPLEMTVIPLPRGQGSVEDQVLSNVNRWREQMQLGPIAEDELSTNVVKFNAGGEPAWLVNIVGRWSGKSAGMAGVGGKAAPRRDVPSDSASRASLPFTCEVPAHWNEKKAGSMQLAAYEIRDGDRKAEVSVSTAGGDLAANINRSRGQVQLDPLPEGELEKATRKITVDGNDAIAVDLVGPETAEPRETILGVVVEARGRQWFIKLRGDADLASRENEHFEQFVQSIRFRGDK